MAEPVRYVVLSEAPDRHHVAIARSAPATGWVQIVATFPRRERADGYAEIENMMAEDKNPDGSPYRPEELDAPPVRDELPSGTSRAVEMIERRSSVETRTLSYVTSAGNERPIGALTDEILNELPGLIEEFPKGPTAKLIATRLCVEEHFVRRAIRQIDKDGQAIFMRRKDSSAHHLVPIGYRPPREELTPTQSSVISAMARFADTSGRVQMSKRDIANKAVVSMGTIQSVLDALVDKKRLAEVERGNGVTATTYRIIETQEAA